MISRKVLKNRSGYSLVELLVTMVIMGLVVTAIYGLHESMQKAEQTGEVVGELQQNLRVGMEFITNDLQLTGFLVPPGTTPIQQNTGEPEVTVGADCFDDDNWPTIDGGGDTCFIMRTATPNGLVARVVSVGGLSGGEVGDGTGIASPTRTLKIASRAMAGFFEAGDEVRIIRPGTSAEVVSKLFEVTAVDLGPDPPDPADPPTITLKTFAELDDSVLSGDILVQTAADHPNTIAYFLLDTDPTDLVKDLMRQENDDAAQVVAENVSKLEFTPIYDSGGTGLEDIRAVRVEIEGKDSFHATDIKTRTVRSTIRLRNR